MAEATRGNATPACGAGLPEGPQDLRKDSMKRCSESPWQSSQCAPRTRWPLQGGAQAPLESAQGWVQVTLGHWRGAVSVGCNGGSCL